MGTNGNATKGFEFNKFATPRIIGGIAIAVIVLWALSVIFGGSHGPTPTRGVSKGQHAATQTEQSPKPAATAQSATDSHVSTAKPAAHAKDHTAATKSTGHATSAQHTTTAQHTTAAKHGTAVDHGTAAGHATPTPGKDEKAHQATARDAKPTAASGGHAADTGHGTSGPGDDHAADSHTAAGHGTSGPGDDHTADSHGAATTGHPLPSSTIGAAAHKPTPKGVAFVEAAIQPMYFELEERWWGWRPNDIINITDNVNHFQLGVLEVTRRTTIALGERISRHGTTDAFDENLEQAMNWFMVKASSYWFPSAESKYGDGLEDLQAYVEKLKEGKATFYTRTDNLIPLLASFEDLLGSCDENLVKEINEDGTPVSFFSVDNYFFYTQGVASSMATILEAVHHDFLLTLESRNATELLHHAIVSCQRAAEMEPWIILDRDLSSILANHRANMAAPISHARFYLGQLIKTLST